MTKAELQKRLIEQAERIAELEEQKEDLELGAGAGELDSYELRQEVGSHFAVLCDMLDECMPFHTLPIRLRLEFEELAECFGVALPLRRS